MTLSFSVDVDALATNLRMSRPEAGFAMRPIGAGTGADPIGRRPKVRDVLCAVGDLVEDIVVWLSGPPGVGTDVDATVFRRRGGSAANVAALAVANGTPARFVGQVGEDDLGARLIADLAIAGVEVRAPRGGRTGSIVVLVSPGGERTMLTDRGAAVLLGPPDDAWLGGVTVLHLPAYSLTVGRLAETAAHLARRARARGILVSIDASSVAVLVTFGIARFQSLLLELSPDVLLANQEEARLLAADGRAPDGVELLVVHAGAGPATVADGEGVRATVRPATARDAHDTTGAGDAFAAGVLPALQRGDALEAALAEGHRCAARTLDAPGASVGAVVR